MLNVKFKKKIIHFFLSVIFIFTTFMGIKTLYGDGITAHAETTADQWTGEGTSFNPFKIATVEHLMALAYNVNQAGIDYRDTYFQMTDDIDLASVCGPSINGGTDWTPIGTYSNKFAGNFDGNGHSILNLYIANATFNYIGFFGYIDWSATIEHLSVEGTISSNQSHVGSIVGFSDGGKIGYCRSNCQISATGSNVGGICGASSAGSIYKCFNTANITGTGMFVGGICGSEGGVSYSYNIGNITGDSYVGGIIGLPSGMAIQETYNIGAISAQTESFGAIYGGTGLFGNPDAQRCYYLNTCAPMGLGGGIGISASQLSDKTVFSGWDFDNTWNISPEKNRPVLRSNPEDVYFDVVFNVGYSGPTPETQKVLRYDTVVKPADPTRSGYVFGGWYSDPSFLLSYEWRFDNIVCTNLTLYANWKENATGSILIVGDLIYGQTLTVDTSGITNAIKGTLCYEWKRGDTTVITSNYTNTYTLDEWDVGNYITCIITSNTLMGSLSATTQDVVGKAEGSATFEMEDWIFGQGVKEPTITSETHATSTKTCEYKKTEEDDSCYSIDAPVNTGNYTVRITLSENSKYLQVVGTAEFSILKANPDFTLSVNDVVYGNKLSPSIQGLIGNYTPIYEYFIDGECSQKTGSQHGATSEGEEPTKVGTYYARATLNENDSYNEGMSNVAQFNIEKAEITISRITANSKIYNGDTDVVLVFSSVIFGGIIEGDSLTVSADGEFTSVNVGENIVVNITNLILGGVDVDNYVLAITGQQATTYGTITPKGIGIVWNGESFVYDGQRHVPTATAQNLIGEDEVVIIVSDTEGDEVSAGEHTAVASITNANYKLPSEITTSYVIGQKDIDIEWGETRFTYNGTEQIPTATPIGLVSGDECNVIITAKTSINCGQYIAKASIDNPNYNLIEDHKNEIFNIEAKEISIVWSNADAIYNGQAHTPIATLSGVIDEDVCNVDIKIADGKEAINVGQYKAIASIDNENYKLVPSSVEREFIIEEKRLTIVWSDLEFVYDGHEHIPSVRIATTGVTIEDCQLVIEGANTNAGTYTATIKVNSNYSLLQSTATRQYTILRASIAVPPMSNKEYIYTGEKIKFDIPENEGYEIINGEQINAGEYVVTLKLSPNHMWKDGSDRDVTYTYTIQKAENSIEAPELPQIKMKKGKLPETIGDWIVDDSNVNYEQAGTYTVILTLPGDENHKDTVIEMAYFINPLMSTGLIIGLVAGGIVVLCGVALLLLRKSKNVKVRY